MNGNRLGGVEHLREGQTMYGHTCSKGKDQPGKVANPARGQLNRENTRVRFKRRTIYCTSCVVR